jgi:hypothetical protein
MVAADVLATSDAPCVLRCHPSRRGHAVRFASVREAVAAASQASAGRPFFRCRDCAADAATAIVRSVVAAALAIAEPPAPLSKGRRGRRHPSGGNVNVAETTSDSDRDRSDDGGDGGDGGDVAAATENKPPNAAARPNAPSGTLGRPSDWMAMVRARLLAKADGGSAIVLKKTKVTARPLRVEADRAAASAAEQRAAVTDSESDDEAQGGSSDRPQKSAACLVS